MDPRERATADALADTTSFHEYRKRLTTKARRMDRPFTVNTLEGVMEGKAGDYLCLDANGNPYPCDADVFHKSYSRVPENDTGE